MTVAHGPAMEPSSRASADRDVVAPGTELGRYIVLDAIGAGGMGVVLRAYDPKLQREVALKRIRPERLNEQAAERMVREAQAMAQLAHPNVVAVHDVEQDGPTVMLVMELVAGRTLREWLEDEKPPWPRILEVFVQAGRGLQAAHAADLMHRDFKPDNVLVGDDGRVRVTDFGLARGLGGRLSAEPQADSAGPPSGPKSESSRVLASWSGSHRSLSAPMTEAGTIMGTPHYMAPEQSMGDEFDARADQYALSVALWEALTGARPFKGSYAELTQAKTEGPPPWPRASAVPRAVSDAIIRGLAPTPAERWPSMAPLLAILDRDPSRGRLRMITAVALGAAAVATVGAVVGWWDRSPTVCTGARDAVAQAWSDTRAAEVGKALRDTGVSYADATATEVDRQLSDYADAWVQMHTEACQASTVRGEQSTEVLDLRMACLQRRRQEVVATAEVLAAADREVVEGAVSLVAALPPLSRCADVESLRAAVPPPSDPVLADAVDQARQELARSRSLGGVGKFDDALAVVDAIPEEALTHEPLAAEVGLRRGRLLLDGGRYKQSEETLTQAYQLALRTDHRRVAIQGLSALGFAVGVHLAREEEGMWLAKTALAMASAPGYERLRPLVLGDLGGIYHTHAHHDEAIEHLQLALDEQRRALGENHPAITVTLVNLAVVHQSRGEFDKSYALRSQTLALERRIFGAEHPRVAQSLHSMGIILHSKGDYQASRQHQDDAVRMYQALLGPDHPETAQSMVDLATAVSALGDYAESERLARQAAEVLERTLGADRIEVADATNAIAIAVDAQGRHEEALALYQATQAMIERIFGLEHPRLASALNNVASVLLTLRRPAEALPLLELALSIQRKALGAEHPVLALFEINIAHALRDLGRAAEAEPMLKRGLPIIQGAYGAEHVYLAYALVGLGRVLHVQGKDDEALPLLERGLKIREQDGTQPRERAEALFAVAKVLWSDEVARERALSMAQDARAVLVEAGPDIKVDREEIDAWLASRTGTKRGATP